MRERVTVVTLSVCLSVCLSAFLLWRRRLFRGWNLYQYILGDDWSVLNVENRSYFEEKTSGTSAVTAVIYSGTTQSLNGLARDLIAH